MSSPTDQDDADGTPRLHLSDRLKTAREDRGLSQAQAARELDVARSAYRLWETGAALPAPKRWQPVATWLGVTVMTLLLAEGLVSDGLVRSAVDPPERPAIRSMSGFGRTGMGIDGPMSEHRLTHEPESAGQARALATDQLGDALPPADTDAFLLMTTELVTNAVRHAPPDAAGKFTLKLEVTETTARAIVIDAGTEFEFDRATFDDNADDHFGLRFVDQLASRWGLSLDGEKAVWFEVDR